MNNEVASLLKSKLLNLNFVDTIAGLVQTIRIPSLEDSENKTEQRFPVSHDVVVNGECNVGAQVALIPDSNRKGILYFEDQGTTILQSTHRNRTRMQSRLQLVCWVNRDKVTGSPYTSIVLPAVRQISAAIIGKNPINEAPFVVFSTRLEGVPMKDANIFGKYTYPEDITQYLMPPFDYFALTLVSSYYVMDSCLPGLTVNPQLCST
jgi:hypothetical protein